MATEKQIEANRLNGLKGGVKTPEGKAISRMNARKHGIFAAALTEHDAEALRGLLDELLEHFKPVGIVEQLLVDKLAVTYLRMQRCAQAEALHYKYRWNMFPSNFGKFGHDETLVTIGLYDARLTKQFLRLLHEIEQRQQIRKAQCGQPQTPQSEGASGRALPVAQIASNEDHVAEETQNEPNSAGDVRVAGEESPCEKMKNEPNLVAQPSATVESSLDPRPFDHAQGGPALLRPPERRSCEERERSRMGRSLL